MGMECVPYCDTGNDTCFGLDVCMVLEGTLGVCAFGGCDPLVQDCRPMDACYFDEGPMHQCRRAGTAVHGDDCQKHEDCAARLHCLSCGTSSQCAQYCDTSIGDGNCTGAAAGDTCQSLGDDVGACNPCE